MRPADSPFPTLDLMQQAVLRSIDDGLSGAVLHLGDRDRVVAEHAYGHQRQWDRTERMLVPELMRPDTMFDLASLTKMFSTVLALHRLVDVRTLSIDDPVARYLPGFDTPDKRSIRLRDLLGHNSGLPSGFHFYDPARAGALFSQDRALTLRLLPQVPLIAPPRTATLYSDLNFVALGAVIEQVTGERQDDFVASRLYAPMGLRRTGYRPLARGFAKGDCVATERCGNTRDGRVSFPHIRTGTLQGEVHDEVAYYSMGQVSGHAGLYSTASELGRICRLLLNGGRCGDFTLCAPETVALFRETFNLDGSYALGWQLPSMATTQLYGLILPQLERPGQVVAHTGWTGQCAVLDFQRGRYLLLLTNRKHSPVIALPHGQLNTFEADLTVAAKYGNVVDLYYRGLLIEQEAGPGTPAR